MANNTQIQAIGGFTSEDLQVMKQTLAAGTTDAQFQLFVRTAAASGLNPFLSHIYAIVYSGKMSLQISVEGIVFLAKKVEGYKGYDVQLIHDNDEHEIAYDPASDQWVIKKHEITFPRGKVIACYARAYREGFKPFTVLVGIDEVEHNLKGTNGALWNKYFNDMFKKTVLKRAIKGQFGIDINEDDSVGGSVAENIPAYTGPRDITDEVNQAQQQAAATQEPQTPPEPPKQQEQPEAPQDNMVILSDLLKQLGKTTKEEKNAYIKEKLGGQGLNTHNIIGLIKILRTELEAPEIPDDLE